MSETPTTDDTATPSPQRAASAGGDYALLRSRWRDRLDSDDHWTAKGAPGDDSGEAGGYHVTSGPLNGYCKPSQINASHPRAAHEKIAADLAHDLGLPLPPVLLHTWPKPPHGDCAHVAISLVPFFPVHRWSQVEALPPSELDEFKGRLAEASAELVAFDTWLDNDDRVNGGNFLVSALSPEPQSPLRVAYIDYSNAMLCRWNRDPHLYMTVNAVSPYPADQAMIAPHGGIIGEALAKIEAIKDDQLATIVNRIGPDFLSDGQKAQILQGLVFRKLKVRLALETVYGAMP